MSSSGGPFDKPKRGLFGLGSNTRINSSNNVSQALLGGAGKPLDSSTANVLTALLSGSRQPPSANRNIPGGMFGAALGSSPSNSLNHLDELLKAALSSSGTPPFGIQPARAVELPTAPPVRRKVFFSFHFEEDIRRSCVVRNSYRFRPGRKLPSANFYDRSLWERSKREGEESLKRLIREGMAGSSVTCVLAGTYTSERPWVRYEIARSLMCGNGLFTVFIHNVKDPLRGEGEPGYNPLACMALQLRADGRGNICELVNGRWQIFELLKAPVRWPRWLDKPAVGYARALYHDAPAYDYVFDDGYQNLARWAQESAGAAGRT